MFVSVTSILGLSLLYGGIPPCGSMVFLLFKFSIRDYVATSVNVKRKMLMRRYFAWLFEKLHSKTYLFCPFDDFRVSSSTLYPYASAIVFEILDLLASCDCVIGRRSSICNKPAKLTYYRGKLNGASYRIHEIVSRLTTRWPSW